MGLGGLHELCHVPASHVSPLISRAKVLEQKVEHHYFDGWFMERKGSLWWCGELQCETGQPQPSAKWKRKGSKT